MVRQNQGLQIALIIFVMLTIVLAVTTFIFFRQYEEADIKANDNQAKADKHRTAANNIQEECNELKRLMGFAATMKLDEIDAKFNQDMQTYAGNFPEDARFYSPVLAYLSQTIQDKNTELTGTKLEIQRWKDKYEEREASKDPQIAQHQDSAVRAGQDLAAERSKFDTERERITKDQAEIAAKMQKARKKADADLARLKSNLDKTSVRLKKLALLNKGKTDKLREITKETFEVPDGEIRWVNQRNATVWINLGRTDSLSRQTTFSVYPADTTDLTGSGKKASIEVTQILGEHLAEARVIEDQISDPIMPGDKIHTPVWSPGRKKRFALAGFMDIDGDGESDQRIVRNLITVNGGVVDCETDAKGTRRGQMSVNTRYLVLGDAPDAKGRAGVIAGYTRMIGEADRLGIQKITLAQLLQQMGWKNQTPMVRFGRGASRKDFRAKPPGGVPGASTGNVSDVFKRRRPPRTGSGGAY